MGFKRNLLNAIIIILAKIQNRYGKVFLTVIFFQMVKINYKFIGWNQDGSSDKVWVVIELSSAKYIKCWGRRGKKLSTQIVEKDRFARQEEIRLKTRKGYQSIELDRLDTVYPEFEKDLQKTVIWSILAN